MKTNPSLLLLLLGAVVPMQAQISTNAVPWVYETETRLVSATSAGVVDMDKASGTFTVGVRQVDDSVVWSIPRSVGFSGVESMAAGRFIQSTATSIAVSSRSFNNAQLVPLDAGEDLPDVLSLGKPEPTGLAVFSQTTGVQGVAVSFESDGTMPIVGYTHGQSFQRWSNYEASPDPRYAGSIHTHPTGSPWVAHLANMPVPGQALLSIFEASEQSASLAAEWLNLPSASRWNYGFFTVDSVAHAAGHQSATLLSWEPGVSTLRVSRLADHDGGTPLGQTQIISSAARSFNMQRPIKTVHVLYEPGGSHRLLISWADAGGGASVHGFDGDNVPTLLEGVGLNGLALDGVAPLGGGGDFIALGSRAGQRSWDLYSDNGSPGHYTRLSTGTLPSIPSQRAQYSNVIAFDGEPLVNPDAASVKRGRVYDWSVSASMGGGAVVTALQDAGPAVGLGSPAGSTISLPGAATHLLLNQITPSTSMALLSQKTSSQAAMPRLTFSPPPGLYAPVGQGEPLAVKISAPGSSIDFNHRYSVNGGPWQNYQPETGILLSANATIRAYAVSTFYQQGSVQTAAYTFGTLPPVAVQPMVDANGNGLSDAWEDLTGIHLPGGDDDGDGYLNLAEHNAGYDANDAQSLPVSALPPALNVVQETPSADAGIRWSASDPAVILETTDDFIQWEPVIQGIYQQSGQNVYDFPVELKTRSFYRLRR